MIGQTIAHYEIVEKIGEGGMGVVYRARDTRLGRDVALKFLSLDFTGSEELKERFIQEAQSASVLDHPNICTIHAIEETEDGRLFIAMGYYPGQTLKAKLREGPLPWQEVAEIAAQIASGLQAAHERGIIHMDVKPANLLVTPEGTVKILDFGLSRFTSEIDRTRPQGPLMGTVAYMSPEQVQGEKTGPESDIWALGVVLYELVTGQRPFQGKNDMAVLYSIVHREIEPPVGKNAELPAELDKLVRRTLVKDRRHRYRDAGELVADLEPLRRVGSGVVPALPRQTWHRQLAQAVTGIVGIVAILLILAFFNRTPRDPGPPAVPDQVLLVGLENAAGAPESEWLSAGASELLTIYLADMPSLHWIRERDLARKPEAAFWTGVEAGGQGLPSPVLSRLRSALGIAWIVSGECMIVGNADARLLEIRLRVQETGAGPEVRTVEETGPADQPAVVVERAARSLATVLGIEFPALTGDGWPVRPEARRLLGDALQRKRLLDTPQARSLLAKADQVEPGNAWIRIHLADALGDLGLEAQARQEADKAIRAARGLAWQHQLHIRAVRLALDHNNEKAATFLRWVWEAEAPAGGSVGRLDLGVRTATLLAETGDRERAGEILAALSADAPGHPLLLLTQGKITASNHRKQEIFAQTAAVALEQDAPLLRARALLLEGQAWQWQGVEDKVIETLAAARQIFKSEGHRMGEADTFMVLGNLYWIRQDLLAAKAPYEEAASLYDAVGARYWEARAMVNIAVILSNRGDFRAAIGMNEKAARNFRNLGDNGAEGQVLSNLAGALNSDGQLEKAEETYRRCLVLLKSAGVADVLASSQSTFGAFLVNHGKLTEARQHLDEALTGFARVGKPIERAVAMLYVGDIYRYQGSLDEAMARYEEALEVVRDGENMARVADALARIGEIELQKGRLAEARLRLGEALEIQDNLTDPLPAGQTRLFLALLCLEEGRPEQAEELAHQVVADLAQRHQVVDKARAHIVLAQVMLAQNRLDSAEEEANSAREFATTLENPLLRIPLEIIEARILVERHNLSEAYSRLQDLLAEAAAEQLVGLQLEIDLALAEIDVRNGNRAGRSRLRDLAEDAHRKGFDLLARKARDAAE